MASARKTVSKTANKFCASGLKLVLDLVLVVVVVIVVLVLVRVVVVVGFEDLRALEPHFRSGAARSKDDNNGTAVDKRPAVMQACAASPSSICIVDIFSLCCLWQSFNNFFEQTLPKPAWKSFLSTNLSLSSFSFS